MAKLTVSIRDSLWDEFSELAVRRRKNPQRLAERMLADTLQRLTKDDLLARAEQSFRQSKIKVKDVEEMIRQHRRDKASEGYRNG